MKPFNIEEAKAGKPVCTREGEPARVICWNKKDKTYPIVALVGKEEFLSTYTEEGLCEKGKEGKTDLMIASEKHEGWVNLYRSDSGKVGSGSKIFKSESEAKQGRSGDERYVTTIKIEWEE